MDREKQIVRAGIISVIGNIALAAMKGVAGTLSGSIAIMLDAINSLTDALSSIIAIIGTRIAGRDADRAHPFGYGRVEYLSSIVIAAIILAAGISSFFEAVRSILHPTPPTYTVFTLSIVAVAASVKFALGFFLTREGKSLNSGTLSASGADSFMDGCVSVATFVAGIVYIAFGWQVESWLAAGIAVLIAKTGLSILLDTSSKLLGERVDPVVIEQVEREVRSVEEVKFASGLVLLDFGPDRLAGAIHTTVDGQMTVAEFDAVARKVQERVQRKCGVNLAGVTPYPNTVIDNAAKKVRATVSRIVWSHDHVVEMRGLYVDTATSTVRFDAIVELGIEDYAKLHTQIASACEAACPDWNIEVRVVPDIAD